MVFTIKGPEKERVKIYTVMHKNIPVLEFNRETAEIKIYNKHPLLFETGELWNYAIYNNMIVYDNTTLKTQCIYRIFIGNT